MRLLHRLHRRNGANDSDEGICQPDMRTDDQLREFQARVAQISAELEEARALLRKLSRLYS
jgi:hypothetical protein